MYDVLIGAILFGKNEKNHTPPPRYWEDLDGFEMAPTQLKPPPPKNEVRGGNIQRNFGMKTNLSKNNIINRLRQNCMLPNAIFCARRGERGKFEMVRA